MSDVRNERTERAIKDAFLSLLQERELNAVTMAELARRADVSRSTLYMHFDNVVDVFEALVGDFMVDVRGLRTQLRCDSCESEGGKRPFCMALRAAGPYQPLVMSPAFLPTYLRCVLDGPDAQNALEPYLATGVTGAQARALFTFQITGCYAAATMGGEIAWSDSQRAIDQFIRGGFASLRNMPPKGADGDARSGRRATMS